MYETPKLTRFGTMRDLTQAGCAGSSDGFLNPAGDPADGTIPEVVGGTTKICWSGAS
jgi:hypothetical protein